MEDIFVATTARPEAFHFDERLRGRQQPECDYMEYHPEKRKFPGLLP
jgi:hypothetical protein